MNLIIVEESAPALVSFNVGNPIVEAESGGWQNSAPIGMPITLSVAAYLQSISMYLANVGLLRLAMYADDGTGNHPSALIGECAGPLTGSPTAAWYTMSLAMPVLVQPGTYWLIAADDASTSAIGYFNSSAPDGSKIGYCAAGSFPLAPLPSVFPIASADWYIVPNFRWSMYATFAR